MVGRKAILLYRTRQGYARRDVNSYIVVEGSDTRKIVWTTTYTGLRLPSSEKKVNPESNTKHATQTAIANVVLAIRNAILE